MAAYLFRGMVVAFLQPSEPFNLLIVKIESFDRGHGIISPSQTLADEWSLLPNQIEELTLD